MKRFLLLCLILILIVASTIYLIDSMWRTRAFADGEIRLAERARIVAGSLDRVLQMRMMQAFAFAALPSVRGFAAADLDTRAARAAVAYAELRGIVAADSNLRAVTILDSAGIVVLTTDHSMTANWRERLFVREALRGQLFASPPLLDSAEAVQWYSAPIIDNLGNVSGVFVLRVTAQEWWDVLAGQSNVRVVDEFGVRLAERSQAPLTWVALAPLSAETQARLSAEKRYGDVSQLSATNLKTLADVANSASDWRVVYREMEGQPAHAVIQRMRTYPWSVIAFEYDEVLTASVDEAWRGAQALVVVMLVVVAVSGWMVMTMRKTS